MHRKSTLLLTFLSIVLLGSCHLLRSILFLAPDHTDYKKFPKRLVTKAPEAGNWQYAANQIVDTNILLQLKDGSYLNLADLLVKSKTNSFLIIKDEAIIYEQYLNGYDETKQHTSFSVSKSMLASLLGIALDEGLIGSYTDPITKYLPELLDNDSAFANITIQHIFEMTSGIDVRKKDASFLGDLGRTYYGNNWSRFMRTIEIQFPAGTQFEYKQTDAQLMGLILSRVSNMTLSDFFADRVWSKISTEQDAYWNYYKKDGIERAFCCYNAVPRDYARFAQLYLNDGVWNGEQIIPKDWIQYVWNRESDIENDDYISFHRYWFVSLYGEEVTAQGYNGQIIYLNPTKNIIILRFGKTEWKKVVLEDWLVSLANQL